MNLSVERAVNMLNLFSLETPERTLGEMTEALGTSRATTHRYALALRRTGMLRWDAETLRYTVGPRIIGLASVALANLPVIDLALPHMERLSTEFDQTVVLSIWDGDRPLVLRAVDRTERVVTVNVRSGRRMSTYESSQGRIFLAFNSNIEVDESRLPEGILDRIRETHVSVYVSDGDNFRAVAAPILQDGKASATLGVVGLSSTVPAEDTSDLATALKRAASLISAELDGEPPDHDGDGPRTPG
jgi:IclR family pca regulon transcriptional regulator